MKPLRKADVMFKEALAGVVEETGQGYRFTYDAGYLATGKAIGVAFPLRAEAYERVSSRTMHRRS